MPWQGEAQGCVVRGGSQGAVSLAGGDGRVLAVLCGVQPTQGHCGLGLGQGLPEGLPHRWGGLGAIRGTTRIVRDSRKALFPSSCGSLGSSSWGLLSRPHGLSLRGLSSVPRCCGEQPAVGHDAAVPGGPGMAPPGGDISTAPGSAPWINPDLVTGAKLKEAELAQNAIGRLKTLLPTARCCCTAPSTAVCPRAPALPLSPALFRAGILGDHTPGRFPALWKNTTSIFHMF